MFQFLFRIGENKVMSNNQAEYEALIIGLVPANLVGIRHFCISGRSQLVDTCTLGFLNECLYTCEMKIWNEMDCGCRTDEEMNHPFWNVFYEYGTMGWWDVSRNPHFPLGLDRPVRGLCGSLPGPLWWSGTSTLPKTMFIGWQSICFQNAFRLHKCHKMRQMKFETPNRDLFFVNINMFQKFVG